LRDFCEQRTDETIKTVSRERGIENFRPEGCPYPIQGEGKGSGVEKGKICRTHDAKPRGAARHRHVSKKKKKGEGK